MFDGGIETQKFNLLTITLMIHKAALRLRTEISRFFHFFGYRETFKTASFSIHKGELS